MKTSISVQALIVPFVAAVCCAGPQALAAQNTPQQAYFDWANPTFPADEFEQRRARMVSELEGGGARVLLIPSSEGLSRGGSFRQNDDFHYFTGLELPRSVLAIRGPGEDPLLFVPEFDFRFESASRKNDFPGRPLAGDPQIAEWSRVQVLPFDSLHGYLHRWSRQGTRLLVTGSRADVAPRIPGPFVTSRSPAAQFADYLRATIPGIEVGSALAEVRRVRGIKSPAAVARLGEAAQLTVRAIARAATFIRDGVSERELEAEFEAECKRGGGQRIPFHPIVKSGPNSLWPWRILAAHYDRRNRRMRDGELVIFDVGCELDHYVSDVGRTFPVSGRFSARQREILEMEVAVADRIIDAIRPGVTFADLRAVADAAIPAEHRPFMQASLFFGHHIGLSTGDPVDVTAPLEPGMVFTVEPWYYNHVEQISVFTEDVVAVTATGVEVLSRGLPRTPDELEAMVRRVKPD